MSLLDGFRHRFRTLVHGDAHARALEEEFRFHVELDAMQQEHAAHGALSPDDARYAARRRFGNLTFLAEETRRMAGLGFLDVIAQDARFALRTFRRTPGFTLVAVLTLAIGIGANTAIFSAVNALLFRPLPFTDPSRLVKVSLLVPPRPDDPAHDDMVWSYPKYTVFRDAQHVFADLALYADDQFTVSGTGAEAERVDGEWAGAGYLSTLGVHPAMGRNFSPDEDAHAGGSRVAILGDAMWKRRFNADPHILGQTMDVGGQPYTIIGVLPPGFRGLTGKSDLMLPMMAQDPQQLEQAWSHSYHLVARLAPGVSMEKAEAVTAQLGRRVDQAFPHPISPDIHWGAVARPLDARRVDPVVRKSLLVLLGAVGLVLLIACANVANLFLVRAAGRRREIAVRLAIGAGRGRLVRQLITESVMLSLMGGAASIMVAWWGVEFLTTINPEQAGRGAEMSGLGLVNFTTIHLDLSAFAFTAVLALATGVLFGLVPALQATHPSLTEALKEGSTAAPGRRLRGFSSRNMLAVVEVALALVLLAGSGLMLRSLDALLGVNPGFDAANVLTMRLNTGDGFGHDSLPGFYDRIIERLGALPGVSNVAISDCPPLNGGCNITDIMLRDRPPVGQDQEPLVGIYWITPQWPSLMHTPVLRGRAFTPQDRLPGHKVVLVNQAAARKFWPGQDPVGKPVSVGQGGFSDDTATVVGVIGDVRYVTMDSAADPGVYLSYYQSPRGRMMLYLRTNGSPLALAPAVRRVMHEMAPDIPLYDVNTMEGRVSIATSSARFSTTLLVLFGFMALALAVLGTYGVISFAVGQRTQEIGIRMALGATRREIVRMVVGQGMTIAVLGGVIGLAAALAATRVLRSLLFEVAPSDPVTFVAIVLVLALAVIAASWLPARRAAMVDPMKALRAE